MITIYFDGASSPFKKNGAGWGWVAYDAKNNQVEQAYGPLDKDASNNFAELMALDRAIEWAYTHNSNIIRIRGDSELVIKWALGLCRCKKKPYWPIIHNIRKLFGCGMSIEWVPRHLNRADKYAKLGKEESRGLG